jgi:hypothetical protein
MSRTALRCLLWICLGFSLAALAVLAAIDTQLRAPASPAGILSFEVCAYDASCAAILDGWGGKARLMAAFSLGVDSLFLAAYPGALCCGLLLAAFRLPQRGMRRVTVALAWIAWGAGAADAVENTCLARMLVTPSALEYAWPATLAASAKFAIIAVALGWLLAVQAILVRRGWKARRLSWMPPERIDSGQR